MMQLLGFSETMRDAQKRIVGCYRLDARPDERGLIILAAANVKGRTLFFERVFPWLDLRYLHDDALLIDRFVDEANSTFRAMGEKNEQP